MSLLRNQISMDAAATILGTTKNRAPGRLTALGFGVECHRCIRGVYANGLGGTACWTCNGTGMRVAITEAECTRAAEDIKAGALAGYIAYCAERSALLRRGAVCTMPSVFEMAEIIRGIAEGLAAIAARQPSGPVRHAARVSAVREWNDQPKASRGKITRNDDGTWSVI